jgi:hypothetical protein
MKKEIMSHGTMTYECAKCGKQWRMYLECGIGSCGCGKQCHLNLKCDLAKGAMTMPFMIQCACGGIAKHIDWHKDIEFPHPMPIFDHMSYFKLDREGLKSKNPQACGIPIVRKKSRDLREQGARE